MSEGFFRDPETQALVATPNELSAECAALQSQIHQLQVEIEQCKIVINRLGKMLEHVSKELFISSNIEELLVELDQAHLFDVRCACTTCKKLRDFGMVAGMPRKDS